MCIRDSASGVFKELPFADRLPSAGRKSGKPYLHRPRPVSYTHLGRAVNAPGLASGPGGAVPVSLAGGPVIRRARLHVEEKGVPGGKILPDHISQGGMDMALGDIPVFAVPGLLRGPVEQGQVQQAVDDQMCIRDRSSSHFMRNVYMQRFLPNKSKGAMVIRHTLFI